MARDNAENHVWGPDSWISCGFSGGISEKQRAYYGQEVF